MLKTTGIIFDGVSSTPQKIEVEFNEHTGQFTFEFPIEQSQQWAVDDVSIERLDKIINLRVGESITQFIKIEDPEFISHLMDFLKSNGHLTWYERVLGSGIKVHIAIALGILGLIVLAYIFAIPWVGEKAAVLIPEEYDIKMGESFYDNFIKFQTIDTAKTEALNQFADQLDWNNTKELTFTVINSGTINAFALPDGHIVVFTGIIDTMQDYTELVGLIGHEVVHVNNRHSMKMLCRNLSGYLFISVVLSDVNGIMAIIGDNLQNLQSLSYSRQFERQADKEGLNLMYLNKVDPHGMTNLFKRLQSSTDMLMPEFLSTHPVTKERINQIERLIQSKPYLTNDHSRLKELFNRIKK